MARPLLESLLLGLSVCGLRRSEASTCFRRSPNRRSISGLLQYGAMDQKTLNTLEFEKVLARLARHTSFSAGRELALSLRPSEDYDEVVRNQRLTAEARRLREMQPRAGLGGVHEVRQLANKANLGGVLGPSELLDVREPWRRQGPERRPSCERAARRQTACRCSPKSPNGSRNWRTWRAKSTAASRRERKSPTTPARPSASSGETCAPSTTASTPSSKLLASAELAAPSRSRSSPSATAATSFP